MKVKMSSLEFDIRQSSIISLNSASMSARGESKDNISFV